MTALAQAIALHQQGRLDEAAAAYEAMLGVVSAQFEATYYLGLIRGAQGKFGAALDLAQKGVALKPDSPQAQAQLGSILLALGRPAEALTFLNAASTLEPDRPEVTNNIGVALRTLGRVDEALERFKKALDLAPDYADARYNLAGLLKKSERYDEAIPHYEKLLALRPDSAEFRSAFGEALWKADRGDEAMAAFQEAIAIDPNFADALGHLANAFIECGRFDEAVTHLEKAISLAPDRGDLYRFLAETRPGAVTDQHRAALEDLARKDDVSDDTNIDANFALGKVYADAGDRTRSFRYFSAANARRRRFIEYDERGTLGSFARIAETFTAEFVEGRRGCSAPSSTPIFIFGMPRSGTTLIEQVLASHPNVYGGGELSLFGDIATEVLAPGASISPEAMQGASCEALREIGLRYAESLSDLSSAALRITDKMPANFRFAALIHIVLPNARMILAKRDPVDTCMSCFSHCFAGDLPWAYDLAELGRYYRGFEKLMEHWLCVLPPTSILEVKYEAVVDDFETEARRIIAYCGLDWDGACLDFHKTERRIRTASATQVRRPIYRTSVHRSHEYGDLLQPLLTALKA
jgi:tetratricopeptide (TPR) repeat protein